jgi:hypothetical protein
MPGGPPVIPESFSESKERWIKERCKEWYRKLPADANQQQRRVMTTRAVWEGEFGRYPIACDITNPSKFITSEAMSDAAIENMFHPTNACNNHYLFGFDGEFVNDRITHSYRN